MIELRQLRYFVAVAEELHFGRAAERLCMAQSPLSQQIIQLERELGVILLERRHRVVGLTDAGVTFLSAARTILQDLDAAVLAAKRADRGETGTICIGYVPEMAADLLPQSLRAFKESHADVDVELSQGTTGDLLDNLLNRTLDVAFLRSAEGNSELAYERLMDEALHVASPKGHSWHRPLRQLSDLAQESFVMPSYPEVQGLRRDIEYAFRAARIEPTISREARSVTAMLLLVAAGAGIALVPASFVRSYPVPGVDFSSLADPPLTNAGLAWRARNPSKLVSNFVETTRKVAASRREPGVRPEQQIGEPVVDDG